MKKIALLLLIAAEALGVQAQQITIHGVDGDTIQVGLRRTLPVSAPRVRYPGFHPDTLLLKKGTIRREGCKPLPCDIKMLRDVAVKLRDGVTIYTDVFLPAKEGSYPAIMAWSPYGKEVGGQMLDDVPKQNGWEKTPKVRLSVLNPGGKDIVDRVEQEWPLKRTTYEHLWLNGSTHGLQSKKPSKVSKQTYVSENLDENSLQYRIKMDKPTEITGYMKLHLWVAADDFDDMDLQVRVEKLDKDGKPIPGATGQPIAATGFMRVSMRKLDTAKSTEAEPYYLFTKEAEQKLVKGKAYPVEIQIWPMGMLFNKGEYLQLTVGAYVPPTPNLKFGSAKITIPAEGMTYNPTDANVKMITLGGDADQVDDKAAVVTSPATHNKGRHTILSGGKYDSYLYVPVVR